MTGLRFRFELDDAAARGRLGAMIAAGEDLSPAMDEIGAYGVTSTQLRFETGIGPDGVAWPPSIRVRKTGGKTLVLSGRLVASLTHVFGPRAAAWGTNVIYAAIHQLGGTVTAKSAAFLTFAIPGVGVRRKKSVEIPARPYLGIDAADRAEITAILADHLLGEVRR